VNFVTRKRRFCRKCGGGLAFISVLLSLFIAGCGDNITLPSAGQLAEFNAAGPIKPQIDVDSLLASQSRIKDYRLHAGDLLTVDMPALLVRTASQIGPQTELNHVHITRIDPQGMMTIPIVGKIQAAGLDISQAESAIAAAYYPKYINQVPSIVVRITEYKTRQVSVTGAVKNPGVYELPTHRMTLVSAIMAAGGRVLLPFRKRLCPPTPFLSLGFIFPSSRPIRWAKGL
jgi:hypothetical protein